MKEGQGRKGGKEQEPGEMIGVRKRRDDREGRGVKEEGEAESIHRLERRASTNPRRNPPVILRIRNLLCLSVTSQVLELLTLYSTVLRLLEISRKKCVRSYQIL